MSTNYTVPPNLKQYVTTSGTYTVDASQLSEPEFTRLNAAAATPTFEATQLFSILKDHPNAYQLDAGVEGEMSQPDNTEFKSPEFNEGDEADIDSLVANCLLKGMEAARKLKKTAQENEQAEVVTKRADSQEELRLGLEAAEARRQAGVAEGAAKIASGVIQIGVAGGSLHQLNKSRKAGEGADGETNPQATHDKKDYHTTLARTLGALGAPTGGLVEGAAKIATAGLTYQADIDEQQAKFTHTEYEASDLRRQNAADLGSTLKETMSQTQQTLTEVRNSTQQQLNNTTGHF